MLELGTLLHSRYRILSQVGKGGMGTVFLAKDENLGITVAVKQNFFDEQRLIEAFKREARLLAGLRHAALPQVKDYFIEGVGQYLIMEYIPGDDLGTVLHKRKQHSTQPHPAKAFDVEDVEIWAEQLLDALDYLHTRPEPVIHRDIKPQNLKLAERGQIILLDFGLAKGKPMWMTRVTSTGSLYGYTPNYAPIEQIRGLGTDPRSDLYGLGATLYHLLTGQPPIDAATRAEAFLGGEPDPLLPPNEVNAGIPGGISNVLMMAMQPHRNNRPSGAAEMLKLWRAAQRSTVVDWQAHREEEGRSWREKQGRAAGAQTRDGWPTTELVDSDFQRQHRIELETAERERRLQEEQRARERMELRLREEQEQKAREEAERLREEQERKAREEAERILLEEQERRAREQAEQKLREEQERRAREEAEQKLRQEQERKAREEAEQKLREEQERRAREEAERRLREQQEREAQAEAERKELEDKKRRDREQAEERRREEQERKAKEKAEKKLREQQERKFKEEAERKHREQQEHAKWEEAERRHREDLQRRVELGSEKIRREEQGRHAMGGAEEEVRTGVWDKVRETAARLNLTRLRAGRIEALTLRPQPAAPEGAVVLAEPQPRRRYTVLIGVAALLVLSFLIWQAIQISNRAGKSVRNSSVAGEPSLAALSLGSYPTPASVSKVAVSDDGRVVASLGEETSVRLWRADGTAELGGPSKNGRSLAISPDGRLVAAGYEDGSIWMWRTDGGSVVRSWRGHTGFVFSLGFSADGKQLCSAGFDKNLRFWRTVDGASIKTLNAARSDLIVTVNVDRQLVGLYRQDGRFNVWYWDNERLVTLSSFKASPMSCGAFSRDGQVVALGSDEGDILLSRVDDGTPIRTLSKSNSGIVCVTFSKDRNTLAAGLADGTIKIWRTGDGKLVKTLEGHTEPVTSLTFSPDNRALISGSKDKTVRVWNVTEN